MEKYKHINEKFSYFQSKKKLFKRYFFFKIVLLYTENINIIYVDLCAFFGIVYFSFFGTLLQLFYSASLLAIIYFVSFYLYKNYLASKIFVFQLYDELSIALKQEITDRNIISSLNDKIEEVALFIEQYEGTSLIIDTLSPEFRESRK